MSETHVKTPPEDLPTTASQEFAAYCESEFERRQNSGVNFDERLYREAMELVMNKLAALEGEG